MAHVITHREYKLLMHADRFPTKKSVYAFNEFLGKTAHALGVQYEPFEAVDSGIRLVQFFDTEDHVFRKNRIILRLRRDQSGGWPDETWEVTFKRRSPDYQEASEFEVGATLGIHEKRKFKEEILRGEDIGSIRRIFSNNNVAQTEVKTFEMPMSRLMEIFPGLRSLELDPQKMVSSVNGARVFELNAKLGTFYFGKDASAPASVAVWMRPVVDAFHPLVAEFGYSYHILGASPKQQLGHEAADAFFKALQQPCVDLLVSGTTKTALIYGTPE